MEVSGISKYVDLKNLVTGIMVGLLTTIIVWFFRSGERLYNAAIAILIIYILGYLILYKVDEGDYIVTSFIESFWVRSAIFFATSVFLFVFIFDIKLSIRTDEHPQFDIVSPVAYPDSAVIIRGKSINKSKKLDIKFNGIEFKDAADPVAQEKSNLWKFDPYNRKEIPSGLVKYGESLIKVGLNGDYYTDEIKIFIDSTSDKKIPFQEIKLEKGWNLLPFNVSDSVKTDSLLGSIESSPIQLVKDEVGRVYGENIKTSYLEYITPGEAYKVYSEKDTTIRIRVK